MMRHKRSQVLFDQSCFEHAKQPPKECSTADPTVPVRRLLGRHCAGIERPSAVDMRRYLLGAPKQGGGKSALDWAAYSMLGKSSVWDILDLIGAGQVPIARIANHVRTLGITSQPVIRLLNLLAPKENAHHKNSKLPRTTPLP